MSKNKLKPQFGKISIILIVVGVVLTGADILTKYLEEAFHWNATIIPGFMEISNNVHNPGCAFSVLNDHPEIGQPLFITATVIMVILLVVCFIFLPDRHTLLKTSIAVLFAGAVGNLYDRIFMPFYVRDWFGISMFGNMTYCNLADFCVVVGAVLAVVSLLFVDLWAVFPLTKSAKAAQAERKEAEDRKKAEEEAAKNAVQPLSQPDGEESDDGNG